VGKKNSYFEYLFVA